jgi:hypothetical protein
MPDVPAAKIEPTTAEEQIVRVARYFRRFREYEAGLPADIGVSPEHKDLVYAFFLNCYHLKDWIKADPALATLGDVEAFINGSPALRLCADICNASKHFELTRPRSNESPAVGIPNLLVGRKSVVLRYEVETNSGPIDSFELAERCMVAWSKFLGLDVREAFGIDFRLYG